MNTHTFQVRSRKCSVFWSLRFNSRINSTKTIFNHLKHIEHSSELFNQNWFQKKLYFLILYPFKSWAWHYEAWKVRRDDIKAIFGSKFWKINFYFHKNSYVLKIIICLIIGIYEKLSNQKCNYLQTLTEKPENSLPISKMCVNWKQTLYYFQI